MSQKFQKNIENFICEHCGAQVVGNGYTNHCPRCLYSKHVDNNPGDRENLCGGMMKAIGVEVKGSEYILIHKCEKCTVTKKNTASPQDDFDDILKLTPKL